MLPARGGKFELISPQSKTIRSQAAASDATVTFVSGDSWSANVEYATDDKGWVTLSQQYGDGAEAEQNLTVSLKANPNQTARDASLIISSGANPEIRISIKQAATQDPGTEEPEWNQQDANAKLAVSNFAKFDAASIDEAAGTVEFCTELNCTSSGWFEWSADWETKTYSNGGKKYRIPNVYEMLLLMPGYDDSEGHVSFAYPVDNTVKEVLTQEILGGKGGEGTSYFRSSAEEIEVGVDPKTAYGVYALRFMGTEQRAAYFYRWYNTGSGTTAYLSIRVKAVADDSYTIDEIADNEEFWSKEYIEINIPACGMNFNGTIMLPGASGDYWTSTSGGLAQDNPDQDTYAVCLSFTDTNAFLGDANKTNLQNVRMVEVK